MWKFIKDLFGVIGGFFRFLAEALEVVNTGLDEVNDGLEKFNEEMKQKRLKNKLDEEPTDHSAIHRVEAGNDKLQNRD